MKKILFITVLLFSTVWCNAQKKSNNEPPSLWAVGTPYFTSADLKGDTLFVYDLNNIHFIKVADKVYQINISLIEVPKQTIINGFHFFAPDTLGTNWYVPYSMPSYRNITLTKDNCCDTIYSRDNKDIKYSIKPKKSKKK